MKKRCAKEALKYIKDKSIIGLGGGVTISYLVSYIKEAGLDVVVVTPSFQTEKLCFEHGIKVIQAWNVDRIDVAFDGCDEVDYNLTALKSGGGIHTKEKIIAKMADNYILLIDESKLVKELEFKHSVALEIIPESKALVEKNIKKMGGKIKMRTSSSKDGFAISDHGLFLMDAQFNSDDVEDISRLDEELKKMVGVVETSLFYNIATKAIVVGKDGIKVIESER